MPRCEGFYLDPPQSVNGSSEGLGEGAGWGLARVGRGCVDGTAFDEHAHDEDEGHAQEHNPIPIERDPLGHSVERGLVKEQVLEAGQRALGINGSALLEHVAVTLEVVAWSARSHKHG